MKTHRFLFLTVVLSLLLLSGACGSSPGFPGKKRDYIGEWDSPVMTLTILDNGYVDYYFNSGSTTKRINGPIKAYEGNNIVVGARGVKTTFIVEHVPHLENGIWKMTVDGYTLTKKQRDE